MLIAVLILLTASCAPISPPDANGPAGSEVSLVPIGPDDLPDPEVVARAYADCMRSKGWNVTVDEDRFVTVEYPDDQAAAVEEAGNECDEELIQSGIVPHPDRPPSDELIRAVYDVNIALHECLAQYGYPVTEVPSWETYRETRLYGDVDDRWNPKAEIYKAARQGDSQILINAFEDCAEEQ